MEYVGTLVLAGYHPRTNVKDESGDVLALFHNVLNR
jgi:hypothetical protein